ncbi:MAG: NMD3-related protein [Candidatus Woesearchaeota archaeon]|jgi:nonsense-mediated mRNA decay protein 3
MKCIQCGKEVTQKDSVLCSDCFQKKHSVLKSYTEHTLLICLHCSSYKYQKLWKPAKPGALQESVLAHCQFLTQPDAIDIEFQNMITEGIIETGIALLKTETTIDGQKLLEEFEFPVRIKKIVCDRCGKLKTEYFEGILQLRGENKNVLEKADVFIMDDARIAEKKNVFITKREEVTNGFDYYYTKQQYLPGIMNKLATVFGATTKTHAELYSKNRQTSKEIYRVNASVRLPKYQKGSVIVYKEKVLQIIRIGKHLTAFDLKVRKNVNIEDTENITEIIDEFKKVHIAKKYPHLEIIHPETFQSVAVENPIATEETEVLVTIIDDKVWIV